MLLLADIHGRKFWKEAVAKVPKEEKIIFLGDYVDPYQYEEDPCTENNDVITPESALENFKEILEFAKENKDRVIMLLGNHDTEYFLGTAQCRCDKAHEEEIASLFKSNRDLFKIGHYIEVNNRLYTFTHSCIVEGWVQYNSWFFGVDHISIKDAIDKLNSANDDDLSKLLGQVGASRWGDFQFGSCVWADESDLDYFDWESEDKKVFQIFGHTQQRAFPKYSYKSACLDCRQGFLFDETNGKFTCLTLEKFELDEETTSKFNHTINKIVR